MATIQGVYIALFGRPADPTGLAYFSGVTSNGANLSAIGNLAGQKEYTDRFSGQSNTQIINSIYQSLFGRDAESAGLEFFTGALTKGTLTINNIAIAILDGAQGSDKTIVANKVAAADLYTSHLDTQTEIGAYTGNVAAAQGRAFITTVTTSVPSAATVDAAILTLQGAVAAGNTITATAAFTALDMVNGIGSPALATTNNNDTINAVTFYAPVTSKIDGGLGVDTLNATINGLTNVTGKVVADGLKNVEIVNLSTVTATSIFDATEAKQMTALTHAANSGAAASNFGLTATNVAQTVTFGLKGDLGAVADSVAFTDADSASSVKVSFNAAKTTGSLTVSDVGTISIANTGVSSVPVISETKTVAVTGDGTLTLGLTDSILDKLDASAFTGKLTFDATANTAIKTVLGGTGGDTLTISTVHTNDVTINGGAGSDILNVVNNGNATKVINLTGGADADQFVFGSAIANVRTLVAADFAKTMINVTDFTAASDAIKVTVAGGVAGALRDTILTAEQSDISAQSSLLDAVTKAASYTDTAHASVFTYGGDSYIFVNDATAGLNVGDTVIHVTGVADVATFTAANFQLS